MSISLPYSKGHKSYVLPENAINKANYKGNSCSRATPLNQLQNPYAYYSFSHKSFKERVKEVKYKAKRYFKEKKVSLKNSCKKTGGKIKNAYHKVEEFWDNNRETIIKVYAATVMALNVASAIAAAIEAAKTKTLIKYQPALNL